MSSKKPNRVSRSSSHRSTLSLTRTEVVINVYDLLPPGRLSSVLWTVGASLLHTGVVINGKEYAYGGHDRRGATGVYWTRPRTEPPGGRFRTEILHGFAFATPQEIDAIVRHCSDEFEGTAYNLLTRNCNHFTSYLCRKLTGRPGPAWLNRAASIGVALPCVVPRDWIEPPDCVGVDGELIDGELVDEGEGGHGRGDEGYRDDERTRMLRGSRVEVVGDRLYSEGSDEDSHEEPGQGDSGKGKGRGTTTDSSGRPLPAAERAPPT
ncbi:hypothetical protein DL767_000561 [Monosporascus sp. MG133]|nr:hypothetical protein DL767_000561 [Monosporascus sp. MG133]